MASRNGWNGTFWCEYGIGIGDPDMIYLLSFGSAWLGSVRFDNCNFEHFHGVIGFLFVLFLFLGAITSFVLCGSVGWVAGFKSIYLPVVVNNT